MNNSTNSNNNDKCKLYVKLQHVINSNFNINRKKQVQDDKKQKMGGLTSKTTTTVNPVFNFFCC